MAIKRLHAVCFVLQGAERSITVAHDCVFTVNGDEALGLAIRALQAAHPGCSILQTHVGVLPDQSVIDAAQAIHDDRPKPPQSLDELFARYPEMREDFRRVEEELSSTAIELDLDPRRIVRKEA